MIDVRNGQTLMVQLNLPENSRVKRRQGLAEAGERGSDARSSASIAGIRTTTPTRAWTPITSTATIAAR